MPDPSAVADDVAAGAAQYDDRLLRKYDRLIPANTRWVWGCHHDEILRRYQAALGPRHLEIGAGSGHCPDRAVFPVPEPELTLLDLNENTLRFSAHRLARYRPRTVVANALAPLADAGIEENSADSVALNLVLHCIPGDLPAKRGVLDNAAYALRPGGTAVGCTVLGQGVPHRPYARHKIRRLNEDGIFHNERDSLTDLARLLADVFARFTLEVRGCMALFSGVAK